MSNINEMMGTITDFLKNEVKTETLIGAPFKLGDFECVPVIAVGVGFGAGGGEGKDPNKGEGTGGGGGAGIGMSTIGFLASNGTGIQFISTKISTGLSAAFEKLPDLLDKYIEKNAKETA